MDETTTFLELKITLAGIKPTISRTIHIEETRTFFELHVAIQIAFGWENSHLHVFEINDVSIGMSDLNEFEEDDTIEERFVRLFQMDLQEKDRFTYIYDFGDYWMHHIDVVKIVESKNAYYPKCIRGSRNRPPEDCGGIDGFENFKEIMGDRKNPEFKSMKMWYGGMYDEDLFLKDQINKNFKNFESIVEEMSYDFEE